MTTMLYFGTYGPDDATRASLPFHLGNGALDAGYNVKILLAGDAAFLMKDSIAKEIHGVAMAPLTELMAKAIAGGAEIHV